VGSKEDDAALAVSCESNGFSIIVVGYHRGTIAFSGQKITVSGQGNANVFFGVFDIATGAMSDAESYGGSGTSSNQNDYGTGVALTSINGEMFAVATGYFGGSLTLGNKTLTSSEGFENGFLFKATAAESGGRVICREWFVSFLALLIFGCAGF